MFLNHGSLCADPHKPSDDLALAPEAELRAARATTASANLLIHIVDPDAGQRARLFRTLTEAGRRCEIYASIDELVQFSPSDGIILAREYADAKAGNLISALRNAGIALAVIVCGESPTVEAVVQAMREGVLSYIAIPYTPGQLLAALDTAAQANSVLRSRRAAAFSARARLARLTPREREVLDLIAMGHSNKSVARELGLSPRTVEIHRHRLISRMVESGGVIAAVRTLFEADMDVGTPK